MAADLHGTALGKLLSDHLRNSATFSCSSNQSTYSSISPTWRSRIITPSKHRNWPWKLPFKQSRDLKLKFKIPRYKDQHFTKKWKDPWKDYKTNPWAESESPLNGIIIVVKLHVIISVETKVFLCKLLRICKLGSSFSRQTTIIDAFVSRYKPQLYALRASQMSFSKPQKAYLKTGDPKSFTSR